MKIFIVYAGILQKSGGMQHACCEMANAFAARGDEVAIACGGGDLKTSFFPLHPDIKIYSLISESPVLDPDKAVIGRHISSLNKLIRESFRAFSKKKFHEWNEKCKCRIVKPHLKSAFSDFKPNVIIAYNSDAVYYAVAAMGGKIPLIGTNHVELERAFAEMEEPEKKALNCCKAIQVLLPSQKKIINKFCSGPDCEIIPNIVPENQRVSDGNHKKLLFVGRLTKAAKRPHLAIQAFEKVASKFPEWKLEMWGDSHGSERYLKEMKNDIISHHMENRVVYRGTTTDIQSVYEESAILVCPSEHEGWGLVVTEAMSAGLPVVAYKSCAGVNELVEDGHSGILVDDGVEPLAAGLAELMANDTLRKTMGANAHQAMKKFSKDKVWEKWFRLVDHIAGINKTV